MKKPLPYGEDGNGYKKTNGCSASSGVTSLLQTLQDYIGCMYLSDLHSGYYYDVIAEAVNKMSAEDFPLEEWKEAISYITHSSCGCGEAEAARTYLLNICVKIPSSSL